MTVDELRKLAEMCPLPLYLFWCYPDDAHPLPTQQLMHWRSMPCTPAGDLVADITNMTFDEAVAVVKTWDQEHLVPEPKTTIKGRFATPADVAAVHNITRERQMWLDGAMSDRVFARISVDGPAEIVWPDGEVTEVPRGEMSVHVGHWTREWLRRIVFTGEGSGIIEMSTEPIWSHDPDSSMS